MLSGLKEPAEVRVAKKSEIKKQDKITQIIFKSTPNLNFRLPSYIFCMLLYQENLLIK